MDRAFRKDPWPDDRRQSLSPSVACPCRPTGHPVIITFISFISWFFHRDPSLMGFAWKDVNSRNNNREGDWMVIKLLQFFQFKIWIHAVRMSMDQTIQIIPDPGNNHTIKAVLRIRTTLMRNRIRFSLWCGSGSCFSLLMRIWILPFTLMRIWILASK